MTASLAPVKMKFICIGEISISWASLTYLFHPISQVSLDPAQPSGSAAGSILLVCQLEDRDLPSVPPLSVAIPHNYPESPPTCDTDLPEYSSTPFLSKLQSALESRLTLMPPKHTLSQLLNAWEMSVRAACSPRTVQPTLTTCLMGI